VHELSKEAALRCLSHKGEGTPNERKTQDQTLRTTGHVM
jgi:hypothetical protein